MTTTSCYCFCCFSDKFRNEFAGFNGFAWLWLAIFVRLSSRQHCSMSRDERAVSHVTLPLFEANTRAYTHPYGKSLYDDDWKLSAWSPEQHCNPLHWMVLLFQIFLFFNELGIDKQTMLSMDCWSERIALKLFKIEQGELMNCRKNKANNSNSNYRSCVYVFRCHFDSTIVIMMEIWKIEKKIEISSLQIKN